MRCRAIILAGALSLFIGVENAEAKLEILVEKASQRMVVIQDGYMRYIWPISTGRDELETPNGTYTPQRLERSWFSSEYYSSPMPYSIFFHNGYAIHGSNAINRLGGPASHGCVRLHPYHAALLFNLVQQEGRENTIIEVTDEPQPTMLPPPPRESEQPREMSSAEPKLERLGAFGDMAELSGVPRAIRPANARTPLPSRSPPADRRLLTNRIVSVNPPRGPCSAHPDSADCRIKPKLAEPAPQKRAEAALPAQPVASAGPAQQAPAVYGFKVLPTSCWSGGASRWRWWRSAQDVPCK
jgi:L,D-transpeptidase catalytic domain